MLHSIHLKTELPQESPTTTTVSSSVSLPTCCGVRECPRAFGFIHPAGGARLLDNSQIQTCGKHCFFLLTGLGMPSDVIR